MSNVTNSMDRKSLYQPITVNSAEAERISRPQLSYGKDVMRRFFKNKAALISTILLLIIVLMSIIGPMMVQYDYRTTDTKLAASIRIKGGTMGPNSEHWFGIDKLGRDLWARVWMGTRYSLLIGFTAAIVQAMIGIIMGCIAGFFGGWVDMLIMRAIDILNAIPYLIYVIIIMMVFGSGLMPILMALALTGWLGMARLVRGQILMLKNEDYILAARNLNTSSVRTMLKHLVPNCMGVIVVSLSMAIPSAIFSEAFLSFLGIGLPAPMTSLGQLISLGIGEMKNYPYQLFIPSAVISLLMLSLQLIGDGLRDALDPKLRK